MYVCMYVCTCMYVHLCIYVCTCTYLCMYVCMLRRAGIELNSYGATGSKRLRTTLGKQETFPGTDNPVQDANESSEGRIPRFTHFVPTQNY